MKKTVDELLAEAAIRDVQITYCRGLDRLDMDLLRSCFHPDATINLGPSDSDVSGFLEGVVPGLSSFARTTHFTGNQLCRVDGEVAWAEHYLKAHHLIAADDSGPERDFVCFERYIDRMECRDGDWRIVRRILVIDSTQTNPTNDQYVSMEFCRGTRDRNDPSWTMP